MKEHKTSDEEQEIDFQKLESYLNLLVEKNTGLSASIEKDQIGKFKALHVVLPWARYATNIYTTSLKHGWVT